MTTPKTTPNAPREAGETVSRLFEDGRDMMMAFHRLQKQRGRSNIWPRQCQIRELAQQLDLTEAYVSKRVWAFLLS